MLASTAYMTGLFWEVLWEEKNKTERGRDGKKQTEKEKNIGFNWGLGCICACVCVQHLAMGHGLGSCAFDGVVFWEEEERFD